MKKLIFIALMFSTLTIAMGQDKGSYITVGGDLGWTKFFYDLDEGSSRGKLGYGGNIGYQYFFSKNWGVGIQAEFSVFNTQSRYNSRTFTFADQVDDEGFDYDLDVTLRRWRENQKTYFFNVPLMLMYQTRFGQTQNVGMYGGIGAKAQLPIKSTYKRHRGDALFLAYYPEINWRVPEENSLPQYGYGSNGNLSLKGDNELKFGVAVTGELGFLFALSRRVDLTVGVSADYGLMDIKDKNVGLLSVEGNQQGLDYIGQNMSYEGILNSQEINKNHPFALKGELGLRIKIGKLTEKRGKKSEDKQDEIIELLRGLANRPADTIILNPTIEVTFPEEYFDRISARRDAAESNPLDGVPVTDIEILMEPVFFDINQSVLRRDARETLDRKMDILRKHDQVRLTIVGHTCNLGSYKLNYELSKRRAETVRSYLISNGIRPSRLTIVPEGMNNPMNPNDTEQHRQLNRQVNFIVGK